MIKAIFAVDSKNGMGKNGTLPWPSNKEDLKYFRDCTINNVVVMGSKTWNDPCFPAPLKNRENIVVSSNAHKGAMSIHGDIVSIIKELDKLDDKDVWIIGGANVINQCWDIIEEIHITTIHGDFDCDVKMNYRKILENFKIICSTEKENIYTIWRRK